MSADTQLSLALYGGLVLRLDTTVDAYDTPIDVMGLYGPLTINFPSKDGSSAFLIQDASGSVLFRASSNGNVNIAGMASGSEYPVVPAGQGRFVVYNTSGSVVFHVNNVGDVHQAGIILAQSSIALEQADTPVFPASPQWSIVGPFAIMNLYSSASMPALQCVDSNSNVVVKITETGNLLYTGALSFGAIH